MKTINNHLLKLYVFIASIFATAPALAKINKPKLPDGSESTDNLFADLKNLFTNGGALVLTILAFVTWVVAAALVIGSVKKGRERGEWGEFWMSLLIAAILVFVGIYFLSKGQEQLDAAALILPVGSIA